MARPKSEIQTERLCVTLPTAEVKAAKDAAKRAGVTWAAFARQALDDAVARSVGHGITGTIEKLTVRRVAGEGEQSAGTGAPSRPEPVPRRTECEHVWQNKGYAVICSKCKGIK